ncbi:polysaccharide deacetylase family protein [Brevibacillus fluminis]|uniref:polysaccharide deacetylase family protein n=1 Tax=Brevibacillus fluminis TaxID=511487 RepID=UPI003F8ABA2D
MRKRTRTLLALLTIIMLAVLPLSSSAVAKKDGKGRAYYEKRGEIVWEVPSGQKVMALTFDDGPDAVFTSQIAELLRKYDAKATFFVVGSRVLKNPSVVRQLAEDGHELANHTFSHPNMRRLSPARLHREIEQTQKAIYDVTGKKPVLFRPPGGYYDESLVDSLRKAGFLVVLWSWHQDTKDWTDPGTNKIVAKVLKNARNGDIVLFHDYGGAREQTVHAIEEILPSLQKEGYRFVTVSELLTLSKVRVNGK